MNLFDEADYIKVYREPTKVRFGSRDCMMCGWGYDPLQYDADVLFTHAEISMFMTRRGVPREEGYKISDLLYHYPLVLSGHYHMRQRKDYERGSIRYVGNPFQMDFSDEDMEKGFDLYDTETGEIEFVENRTSPKYHVCKLSSLIKNKDFAQLSSTLANSYTKLVIDRQIKLQDVDRLANLIKGTGTRDVIVEWENGQDIAGRITSTDFSAHGFDILGVIEEYIDSLGIEFHEWVKRYIIALYEKAEN